MKITIPDLISMCERRLANLQSVRGSAVALGDIVQVGRLDGEISETQATLNQLRTIPE